MAPRNKDMASRYTDAAFPTAYTVSANAARVLLDLAVSRGANRWTLAERSGIDLVTFQNNDNRIPFASYVALMRCGKELCNDPALALHFGEAFDPTEITFTSQLGPFVMTLADSIALMNRYSALTIEVDSEGDRLALERTGGQTWIVDRRRNPNDFPELTESTFARVVCTSRRMLGGKSFVKAVHVTHAEPAYRAEYDRIFQVPLTFGSDKNALLIGVDGRFVITRPEQPSPEALERLSAHADTMLEQLEKSKSTRARVESLLIPALRTGDANMEAIARKLSLTRQTLFRKLKAEGVTFEKVLDELRHKLAFDYLREQKSVKEIAYILGFSDPSAFSRAFKRWTGKSPRGIRDG